MQRYDATPILEWPWADSPTLEHILASTHSIDCYGNPRRELQALLEQSTNMSRRGATLLSHRP